MVRISLARFTGTSYAASNSIYSLPNLPPSPALSLPVDPLPPVIAPPPPPHAGWFRSPPVVVPGQHHHLLLPPTLHGHSRPQIPARHAG